MVWEILQDRVYKNQIENVEELRQRVEEWAVLISEWLTLQSGTNKRYYKHVLQLREDISNIHF